MPTNPNSIDALTIHTLAARYRSGKTTPTAIAEECFARIEAHADPATWISLFPREAVLAQARGGGGTDQGRPIAPAAGRSVCH